MTSRLPKLFGFRRIIILFASLALTGIGQWGEAEEVSTEEWNISADKVIRYEEPNSIVATGNVILEKKKKMPLQSPVIKSNLTPWAELLEEGTELPEITAGEISDTAETEYKTTVTIKADWIVYDVELELIKAKGNLLIITDEDQLHANEGTIKLANETGQFTDAKIIRKQHSLHFEGKSIEKTGFDTYHIKDGWVITCKLEEGEVPPWSFSSADADIRQNGYAFLKHARFNIRNIPVFYTPYLVVPVKNTRQTGFLLPEVSSSQNGGWGINLPFFLNISESMDATFFPEYFFDRGFMPGVEFRYVEKANDMGMFSANYLDDKLSDRSERDYYNDTGYTHTTSDRYWVRGKADHVFGDNWISRLDIDIVSDQDYLTEFKTGSTGFSSNQDKYFETFGRGFQNETALYRENSFKVLRSWNGISFETDFLAINEADDDASNTNTPLWKLPSLNFTGAVPVGETNLTFDWNADYVNYWRDDGIGGQRVDLRPSIGTPIPLSPYLESRAEFAVRDTFYYLQTYGDAEWEKDDNQNRFLAEFQAEIATTLEKDFFSAGNSERSAAHKIRPFIHYNYIDDVDQDDLPSFDEIDMVNNMNMISYGIDNFFNTFTAGANNMEKSSEYGYFKIHQYYDLRDSASDEPFSEIYNQLALKPLTKAIFSYKNYYDVYDTKFTSHTLEGEYTNSRGDYFSVDYSYKADEDIKQINGQLKALIFNRWLIGGGIKHSISHEQTDEASASLTYQALCWSINFETQYTPYDTSFLLTFNLANIGSSLGMTL